MIIKAFSVYDRKTNVYGSPFFVRHVGEAVRSFMDACNDPKVSFGRYPEDYVLFAVGAFDDESGIYEPCQPQQIVTASEMVGRMSQ